MGRGRPPGSKNKATINKVNDNQQLQQIKQQQQPQKSTDQNEKQQQDQQQQVQKKRGRHPNPQKHLEHLKKVYQSQITQVYTELAKTCLGNTQLYNLYGIVIDATMPHLKENETNNYRRYKQHVKIIDPTVHFRRPKESGDTTNVCISVTFFGSSIEQLPVFKRIGDIIRIHRCNIAQFKERKTFSVIINFGSHWVIFDGRDKKAILKDQKALEENKGEDEPDEESKAKQNQQKTEQLQQSASKKPEQTIKDFFGMGDTKPQPCNKIEIIPQQQLSQASVQSLVGEDQEVQSHYLPLKLSSKDYTMTLQDRDIIKRYREWSKEYFLNEFLYESQLYITLSKVRDIISNEMISGNKNDSITSFDLIVQVEQIDELGPLENGDMKLMIRISDQTSGEKRKNILQTKDSSNIMLIESSFKQAQQFLKQMETTDHDLTPAILGEVQHHHNEYSHLQQHFEEVLEKPEIASSVGSLYLNMQSEELSDILQSEQYANGTQIERLSRVQFYVLNIQPLNLFEVSRVYCPKCYSDYSYKDFNGQSDVHSMECPQCHYNHLEAIYKIQFQVKDKSLYHLKGAMKMILYTMDGICNKFFNGIEPCNFYREQTARNQVEKHLRYIVRFNVFLDAIVETKYVQNEIVLKLISCKLKNI
ncbi:alpha telomere binding protein [Stylonychia lemnae]|uniref:Alpha telomere binding protein n=1 Tax=Stylonychia lemnae TaxID=5949 RepID=A0A078A6C9_STYLE|nr:alpha telomere binding protein [Stylonychia lemnae]|eukprot:CDW77815.1 alpha telomere binding protein [Stylonychia lemnae]